MEFYANLAIVRRHVWLVLVTVAVASLSAFVVDHRYHAQPTYSATATLSLNSSVPNRALLTYDPSLAQANRTTPLDLTTLVSTYDAYLVDTAFDQKVVDEFHLPLSAAALGATTSALLTPNTVLYRISATSTDGRLALREAEAVAQGFVQADARAASTPLSIAPRLAKAAYAFWTGQVQSLQSQMLVALDDPASSAAQKAARYTALEALLMSAQANQSDAAQHAGVSFSAGRASTATLVSTEGPVLLTRSVLVENIVVVAALGGLILGLALALLREYLNTTIRDAGEASRELSLPVLSSIGRLRSGRRSLPALGRFGPSSRARDGGCSDRLVTMGAPFGRGSESFRTLRTSILFGEEIETVKVLVVSSVAAGEGRSLLAANLAVVMAQSGRQVILVDADLRRPTQQVLFEAAVETGLSALYLAPEDDLPRSVDAALHATQVANLRLLAAGPQAPNPAELLTSARTGDLFSLLKRRADLVIVDTPAMGLLSDAIVLASHADSAIMVVRAHGTHRDAVRTALGKLSAAGTRVLGLVLNMDDAAVGGDLRRYGYDYRDANQTPPAPPKAEGSSTRAGGSRVPALPGMPAAASVSVTPQPIGAQPPRPASARFVQAFDPSRPGSTAPAAVLPRQNRRSPRLFSVVLAVLASIGVVLIGHMLSASSAPTKPAPSSGALLRRIGSLLTRRTPARLASPTVAVDAGAVKPESALVVHGSGFQSGETVTLALNGRALPGPALLVANATGAFTASIAAPSSLIAGRNDLSAVGSMGSAARTTALTDTASRSTTSYLVGGFEGQGSQSVLDLMNDGPAAATAYATFYDANGQTTTATFIVAAHARLSAATATLTSLRGSFGLRVVSSPHVQSQLEIQRSARDGDVATGVEGLSKRGYLAEGYTGFGFRERITIFNPSDVKPALVVLHLLPVGAARRDVLVAVRAHATALVGLGSIKPNRGISVIFSSNQAVLVARTLAFSHDARGAGYGLTVRTAASTAASAWLFAAGSASGVRRTTIILLNPNRAAATATMRFYGRGGLLPRQKTVVVPALGRVAVALAGVSLRGEVASLTTSTLPIVAEQTQYVRSPNGVANAGGVVVGANGPATQWSFPGAASPGGTQVLQLFNPSAAPVTVTVTTFTMMGTVTTRSVTIPARARLDVQTAGTARSTDLATLVQAPGAGVVASQLTVGANQSTLSSAQGTAR